MNNIPQYFLDNKDARNQNTESRQKMREMITYISTLPTLNETLGIINDVDNDVIKEEMETEERIVDDKVENDIRTITRGTFERKKKTLRNGKVLKTDFVENIKMRKEERKQLMKPKPVSKIEYMDDMKVLGERRVVDEVIWGGRKYGFCGPKSRTERGRILQNRQYLKKQRTVTTDCDGNVTYSPWEIVSSESKEVEISRF